MGVDWERIREEFPALRQWTFLNTATFGQLPRRAVSAMQHHLARRDALACSDFLSWFDDADEIRRSIAQLIHARLEDIAFFPNASAALSLLIAGIDWKPGDEILTLENEFPNNLYCIAPLAGRGVELVEVRWEDFYEALGPKTRLVAISLLNYTNGFRPPLVEVAHRLRQRRILFYLDGTQGVGAISVNLCETPVSMLAVHGYKWLLSPTGAGFAYIDPSLRSWLPPAQVGWRSHFAWREVDQLHHGMPEYDSEAWRYEPGMLPFPVLYGMAASVEMMLEIGPSAIERRVLELADDLRRRLRALGAELPDDRSPCYRNTPIVAARFPGIDVVALVRRLKDRRVLVSARHGNLRVSVHFYNNESDLERLEGELRMLLR
jgi:cysteine desulfurase/selenocysteine lyase